MSLYLPEFVGEDFEHKFLYEVSESVYHSDHTAVSSSGLKTYYKSPYHYYTEFVTRQYPREDKPSLAFGRAVHMAILQYDLFRTTYRVMPDFGDLRKKENKEKKQEWLSDVPESAELISHDEFQDLVRMVESLQANKYAMNLIKDSKAEVTGYFRDPVTGLKCRMRPDILKTDLSVLPDLKTTLDASPNEFSNQCWKYGYFIQMAFYSMGVKQITGKAPELPCFIVIEKKPPYSCVVYAVDEGMMSRGEQTVRRLLDQLSESVKTGLWPGYVVEGVGSISLPAWTDWRAEI